MNDRCFCTRFRIVLSCIPFLPSELMVVSQFHLLRVRSGVRYLSTNLLNLASHLEIRLHLPTNSAEEPKIHAPAGGMFLLVDVSATGLDGHGFAERLLESVGVSVVPGFGFGESMKNFVRIGYLSDIGVLEEAIKRIARFMGSHKPRLGLINKVPSADVDICIEELRKDLGDRISP